MEFFSYTYFPLFQQLRMLWHSIYTQKRQFNEATLPTGWCALYASSAQLIYIRDEVVQVKQKSKNEGIPPCSAWLWSCEIPQAFYVAVSQQSEK